jgi:hypothetical protein
VSLRKPDLSPAERVEVEEAVGSLPPPGTAGVDAPGLKRWTIDHGLPRRVQVGGDDTCVEVSYARLHLHFTMSPSAQSVPPRSPSTSEDYLQNVMCKLTITPSEFFFDVSDGFGKK